jgi:bacterioferritin-associated ferredoxin
MYVCLCRGVTDRHIREAVAEGASSMRALRVRLGVCSECDRCGSCARAVLAESLQEAPASLCQDALTPALAAG